MNTQDEIELHSQIYENCALQGFSEVTSYNYFLSCRVVFNKIGKRPCLVTDDDLLHYFNDYLKTSPAPQTIGSRRASLSFFYKWALHRRPEVLKDLKIPKQRRLPAFMVMEEVEVLLKNIRYDRYRVMIRLAFSCGLRVSEVTQIKISDINKYKLTLFVEAGKGRKDRYVPLPENAYQMLREYWAQRRPPKPYIFVNPRTKRPYTSKSLQWAFREARNAAGLSKSYSFHTLRHSYATCLLDAGLDIRILQRYLGHSHLNTTMLYLHMSPMAQMNARQIISGFFESFSYHA